MTLQELVMLLEFQKPEASQFQMMILDESGEPFNLKDIRVDSEFNTVWLMIEDF